MAFRVSREHFERLAEKAIGKIPRRFVRYFTNISVIVEDHPSAQDAQEVDVPGNELLGLFKGHEYPGRGGLFDLPPPFPDTIVLYKENIEEICHSEKELIEEIRKTLVHEVGHYFGLSEEDLAKYE